ncbi:DUF4307 domain-containing protein [Actinocrinis sp.]|uniref:DUF4307 domain-containing protein n=1 Tax=Actinocrinis sp. TaxID=1920516 RepID=UPI002D3DC3D3|nr:DUF4307 domain-containing protein [Actinocrinis sp.]HZP50775.1 DUF4307 domain-containing protein [Actinocrinis sp.]
MTDTISSTPEPPRPQPGSEPLRPQQRFRLPDPQSSATGNTGDRPATQPANPQTPFARAAAASGGGTTQGGRPGAPGSARLDSSRTAMTPPEGRYGEKGGMSGPRKVGLGVVGLAVLGGVGGYIAWQLSHPDIQGTVTSFNATTATSVIVTFEVDKPADKSATCTLVAVDGHGAVVGTASVPILSGRAKNVQTYTLQTTTTANTVTVQTCKLTG